jgi:hypothetical protein
MRKKPLLKRFLQEIREDVCTIEDVTEFFESPQGAQVFGAEKAKELVEHAHEVKAKGGKWCFCPACAAGVKILDNASWLDRKMLLLTCKKSPAGRCA